MRVDSIDIDIHRHSDTPIAILDIVPAGSKDDTGQTACSAIILTGGVECDVERVMSELVAGETLVSAVVELCRVVHVQYRLVACH